MLILSQRQIRMRAIELRRIKPANQTTKGFDFMSNKKYRNHFLAASLILGLSFSLIAEPTISDAAHRLNKRKVSLRIGTSYKLKVKGRKRTVTWRSSKKKIATVSKKGKVTAKKAGTATITAKIGKKCLRCQVTVIKPSAGTTTTPVTTQKPAVTQRPTITFVPTTKPTVTPKPTSTPNPTATSGSTVTETSAYQTLNSLRSTYPEGMPLTNSDYYYSNVFGNGYGCYGFAAKLSDTIFGTTKAYTTHSDFSKIKVGDHVRIGNYHSVVCLTKGSDSITVVEGNYNSSVHWDRKITKSSLASEGFKVYTRY